jgi:hypothetical protein
LSILFTVVHVLALYLCCCWQVSVVHFLTSDSVIFILLVLSPPPFFLALLLSLWELFFEFNFGSHCSIVTQHFLAPTHNRH